MTSERLAEIKHNLEHAGRTHYRDVSVLLAENAALREELAAAERRRGGECDTCGGWICPPLRCAACMMTKRLTPDSDPGPLAADAIRQQDKQLAALRKAVQNTETIVVDAIRFAIGQHCADMIFVQASPENKQWHCRCVRFLTDSIIQTIKERLAAAEKIRKEIG